MRVERRCAGSGLIIAGLVVTLIGLALVAGESLHLPRHWQTVAVGAVLVAVGLVRRAIGAGSDGPARGVER